MNEVYDALHKRITTFAGIDRTISKTTEVYRSTRQVSKEYDYDL